MRRGEALPCSSSAGKQRVDARPTSLRISEVTSLWWRIRLGRARAGGDPAPSPASVADQGGGGCTVGGLEQSSRTVEAGGALVSRELCLELG